MLALSVSITMAQPPEGRARGERPGEGRGRPQGTPGMAPEAMVKRMLEQFDKDGDKKLDATELMAALREMRNMRGGPPMGDRRPGNQGPGNEADRGAMAARILERIDTNKDGKLTGDEIPERMRANIERIDANSDGAIEKSELETMMSRMRGGRGPGGGGERGRGGRPGGDQPRRPPAE